MDNFDFIGRARELNYLSVATQTKTASLVVIKGRRRIGKSRLIDEFSKKIKTYRFNGLAPNTTISAQLQRDHFALQLSQQSGLPEIQTNDWSKLFILLNEKTKTGRVIIILDEITWMAADDPSFLSKLHDAWENYFKKNPKIILIICGSVSAWIEKNLLSNTGYFGRVSLQLTLEELPLHHCNQLINETGFIGSSEEKLMLLSIMGGVPWYIEQINPTLSAIENIKRLCFTKDGLLVNDFKRIFHDLFGDARGQIQTKIVSFIAKGPADYDQIVSGINYASGGSLSSYIDELVISGFIQRDYTWSLKTGKTSSLSKFRLKDNYLRFYLKYIAPRIDQVNKHQYLDVALSSLPAWECMMGLQLENLVLNNRRLILEELHVDPNHIVNDNPYFQRKTAKQQGCQIDYLIQTKYKTLYVCEIKFSSNKIKKNIINQVKEKIERIKLPRGYSCIPVLITASDVTEEVLNDAYFSKIINLPDLMERKQ